MIQSVNVFKAEIVVAHFPFEWQISYTFIQDDLFKERKGYLSDVDGHCKNDRMCYLSVFNFLHYKETIKFLLLFPQKLFLEIKIEFYQDVIIFYSLVTK